MTLPSASTLIAIVVAYGVFIALSRRALTALALTLYFIGFVLLSSYLKHAYLGMAMTLADMHFFLLRPLENFHLFATYPVLGLTLVGVIAGVALLVFLGGKFEPPTISPVWRWAIGASSLALGVGSVMLASRPGGDRASDGDAWAAFQTMYAQLHPGGPMGRLNVFFNNRSFEATLPVKRTQSRFTETPISPTRSTIKPDILLVLEESTFDPMLIRNCPKEYCDHAILHPPPDAVRTQQGPLLVHTTGGGTWLAEFAVVSGFDWRIFGRGGAYAPVSLAPRLQHSLPRHLLNLGYRTVAIYPTEGNFLSATTAYDDYGFEEFYARAELELPDEWGDARDGMVFDRAMQALKRHDDGRPVFVFVLTIRNHGPHEHDAAKVPVAFAKAAQQLTPPMADFLARMRDSSEDYLRLAKTWLSAPKPRVIAWFGDHQPEAAWHFTEHPELLDMNRAASNVTDAQLQYLTLYQLSANYGTPQQLRPRTALDLSFFGAELLAFAGLPLDASHAAAREVSTQCNGLLLDCSDRALVSDYLSFRIHELGAVR